MLRCKGVDGDFHNIEWQFIRNAWVPAITVCTLKLDAVLTRPETTVIDAVEVEFGGSSNGPYTFTENVPFWIKWRPSATNNTVYVSVDTGATVVTDEMISLDTILFYEGTNLNSPIDLSESEPNDYAYSNESGYWFGIYTGDYIFTENVLYYSKIISPVSGSFTVSVAFD